MIHCIGINHDGANIATRETLAIATDGYAAWTNDLRAAGALEVVVLSTCNRTEWYLVTAPDDNTNWIDVINARLPGAGDTLRDVGYQHRDYGVFLHLCRVTAGLDSLVPGEPQIFGQIKTAYEQAVSAGAVGAVLHRVFQRAFKVAKQIREETSVGERPLSVGAVAVLLAEQIVGQLSACTALVIGAGEMGQLVVQHLRSRKIGRVLIVNRTGERASAVAQSFGAEMLPWSQLSTAMAQADIIIGSAACEAPLVRVEALQPACVARAGRPLFCIDIALPRTMESAIASLPNVYLYDLDDLQAVIQTNRAARTAAMGEAEALLGEAAQRLWQELGDGDLHTLIAALHQKCESIRRGEVERTLARLHNDDPRLREALVRCTEAIVAKILHDPIVTAKSASRAEPANTESAPIGHWLRKLFRLEA